MIVGSLLLIFAAVVMLVFGVADRSAPLLIGSIVGTLLAVIVLIGSARRTAAARLAAGADSVEVDGSRRAGSARARPSWSRPFRARSRAESGASVHSGGSGAGPVATGTVIEGSVVDEPPDPPERPAAAASAATASAGTESAAAGPAPSTPISTQVRPTVDLNARRDTDVPHALVADAADEGDVEGEYTDDDPPGEPPPQLVSPADAALVARMDATVLVVDGRPRYHRAGCGFLRGRPTEPLPVNTAVELGFTPCGRCEPDTALVAGARSS
jgi:hypothetical protein